MRKTGGILILCTTVFGLIANGLMAAFLWSVTPSMGEELDLHPVTIVSGVAGNLLVSFAVITLAIILLNTHGKWPAVSILVVAALTIWQGWGGGVTTLVMVIAVIGALLALKPVRSESMPTAHSPAWQPARPRD